MLVVAIIAATLLAHNGDVWPPPVVVDAIEHNTTYYWTYDEWRGQWRPMKSLDQTIAWKLDPDGVWHADWWVMGHQQPVTRANGYYVFRIEVSGSIITVHARHLFTTVTLGDPERADISRYPSEWRAGLKPWTVIEMQGRLHD
ncbi:MAG: hypothetical protein KatS3mg038_3815 [Candidatus Kapaibacterium sp.]|nr:MAG: hypothetical protein KatS3mg038_3815 [Candidatus Kapabacteria bacterium]